MLRKTFLPLCVGALLGTALVVPTPPSHSVLLLSLGDLLLAWVVLLRPWGGPPLGLGRGGLPPGPRLGGAAGHPGASGLAGFRGGGAGRGFQGNVHGFQGRSGALSTSRSASYSSSGRYGYGRGGRQSAAGHAMAPMLTAVPLPTAVPMPIAAATTLTATPYKGAFRFAPTTE